MDKIKAAERRYPDSDGNDLKSALKDNFNLMKRHAFIAGWDAALSTQSPKWVQCPDGNKYLTVNNILCFVSNEGDGCIEADGGGSRFLLAKNEDGSFYVANSMNGFGENTHKEFASAKVVLLTPIESSSTHPLQEKIDGLRGFMARIYTFVSKDVQDLIKQALETYK